MQASRGKFCEALEEDVLSCLHVLVSRETLKLAFADVTVVDLFLVLGSKSVQSLVRNPARTAFGQTRRREMSPDAHYSGDRRLSPCRHSVAASYVTTASEHTAINSPRISSLDRHSNVVVKEGSSGIDFLFMRNWAQMVKTQASEPRMESELYVFFYNVLSSVEHLVSGNPAEEYKLANTPDVISAIAALIRYQAESMHDRATLLL